MLKLRNISVIFAKGTPDENRVISDLSFDVADGDFITIIGANGAGKSTLFNAIAGTVITDAGSVLLDGEDITLMPEYRRAKKIGRLFQDPMRGTAPGMTIEENLALAAGFGGWLSLLTGKQRTGLRDRVAMLDMGLEDKMDCPVGSLSGGQRQALTLVMATYHTPSVLLLDECTAALDPGTAATVLKIIRKDVFDKHITCLMITHDMQMALDIGNRTVMLDHGRIVLDIDGERRRNTTVPDLLDCFRKTAGRELTNDRMLLT